MPSKSSLNNDSTHENSSGSHPSPAVKKSKKFKRIRGLLSGESRKEKKKRRDKTTDFDKDDETTYRVNVEERSVATAPPPHGNGSMQEYDGEKPFMLKVALLLMDSRRFELLQLEFDSLKALVSDVMAQIPISVTDEALRKQTYLGICGHSGEEIPLNSLLSSFCKGNDILIAMPQGVPAKECARLAVPILTDNSVAEMLRKSGIDVAVWMEAKNKKSKGAMKASSKTGTDSRKTSSDMNDGSTMTGLFLIVVIAAIILQVFHLYISAPIKPGHIVSPGIKLSKCGVLSFLPTCSNTFMSFDNESTVSARDSDNNLLWQIRGSVCKKGDKGCIRGLKVGEEGDLRLGGRIINSVYVFRDDVELSPWPFAEPPKVRIKRSVLEDETSV